MVQIATAPDQATVDVATDVATSTGSLANASIEAVLDISPEAVGLDTPSPEDEARFDAFAARKFMLDQQAYADRVQATLKALEGINETIRNNSPSTDSMYQSVQELLEDLLEQRLDKAAEEAIRDALDRQKQIEADQADARQKQEVVQNLARLARSLARSGDTAALAAIMASIKGVVGDEIDAMDTEAEQDLFALIEEVETFVDSAISADQGDGLSNLAGRDIDANTDVTDLTYGEQLELIQNISTDLEVALNQQEAARQLNALKPSVPGLEVIDASVGKDGLLYGTFRDSTGHEFRFDGIPAEQE